MSAFGSTATILAASLENNAGGASAADLGLAGAIGGFALIFVLMGGLGHRGELIPTLGWFERFSEKRSNHPSVGIRSPRWPRPPISMNINAKPPIAPARPRSAAEAPPALFSSDTARIVDVLLKALMTPP